MQYVKKLIPTKDRAFRCFKQISRYRELYGSIVCKQTRLSVLR